MKQKTLIHILLVEDDIFSQRAMKIMLESLGCHVDIASTGQEALSLAKKTYDLIFMDLGLPDIDGFKLTQTIKEPKGANSNTPVVAQTANITDLYRKKAQEVGMKAIVAKPLTSTQFKDMISAYTHRT